MLHGSRNEQKVMITHTTQLHHIFKKATCVLKVKLPTGAVNTSTSSSCYFRLASSLKAKQFLKLRVLHNTATVILFYLQGHAQIQLYVKYLIQKDDTNPGTEVNSSNLVKTDKLSSISLPMFITVGEVEDIIFLGIQYLI